MARAPPRGPQPPHAVPSRAPHTGQVLPPPPHSSRRTRVPPTMTSGQTRLRNTPATSPLPLHRGRQDLPPRLPGQPVPQLPPVSENPVRGSLCLVDGRAGVAGRPMVSRYTTAPNDTEHVRSRGLGIWADAAGRRLGRGRSARPARGRDGARAQSLGWQWWSRDAARSPCRARPGSQPGPCKRGVCLRVASLVRGLWGRGRRVPPVQGPGRPRLRSARPPPLYPPGPSGSVTRSGRLSNARPELGRGVTSPRGVGRSAPV